MVDAKPKPHNSRNATRIQDTGALSIQQVYYTIASMEERVKNLPRITIEDEEMYWRER